jgi:hypothetical protein
MRKLVAKKRTPDVPLAWKHRNKQKPVFHEIKTFGQAMTLDGPMTVAVMTQVFDINRPNADVAALVGTVSLPMGEREPIVPIELYFWDDKFWVKAVDKKNVPYYNPSKEYLLYQVEIQNPDALLQTLTV